MDGGLARRCGKSLIACLLSVAGSVVTEAASPGPLTLDDLFDRKGVVDVAVSPSGRYLAGIVRQADNDVVLVVDAETGDHKVIARVGLKDAGEHLEARITSVYWKSDDRILFRSRALPSDHASRLLNSRKLAGTRLFSIKRDGSGLVRLLQSDHVDELAFAFNLGEIRSLMPRDPESILMVVDGINGRSLFKVNVVTGKGDLVERARDTVWDWWLDLDGNPVVRVDVSMGSLRFFRHDADGSWKKFYSVRVRELKETQEYEPLGPSNKPGAFYVLARPDGAEHRGVYLYDLAHESFGPALAENSTYDIFEAEISRGGERILRYCYVAHVRVCESPDPAASARIAAVRRNFRESANVFVVGGSEDSQTLLLLIEGPSDPPGYYLFHAATGKVDLIGLQQQATAGKLMPAANELDYTARDGTKLSGYLTLPPGVDLTEAAGLPLVVFPHGGPEARDYLRFDYTVEYLAARGYAVFQLNFRGSDGFGRKFAESGYGQWGRRMQDDITDGVKLLIARKTVDPARVCIVGASYGGYAALAGATFTPELYRCAVAISGPADLAGFLKYRRKLHGANSELYGYWKKQIGDPDVDPDRIAAISPALHIDQINAPILLVHGDQDDVVPYDQSADFKRALDKSGRKTELITLKDEGHSDWSDEDEQRVLQAVDAFLRKHIGPGHLVDAGTAKP